MHSKCSLSALNSFYVLQSLERAVWSHQQSKGLNRFYDDLESFFIYTI